MKKNKTPQGSSCQALWARRRAALEAVERHLRALGDRPGRLVPKGKINSPRCCPVAKYLNRRLRRLTCSVTVADVLVRRGGVYIDKVPTPAPIAAFIYEFDNGSFSELVMR
jgi:hypothetical protein